MKIQINEIEYLKSNNCIKELKRVQKKGQIIIPKTRFYESEEEFLTKEEVQQAR